MAGRSSTTFKKRQKELARQDKQREKAAKREQRKQHKLIHGPDDGTYNPEDDPFGFNLGRGVEEDQQEP